MIYLGPLYQPDNEDFLLHCSRGDIHNAANVFQWNILNGFLANGESPIIINALPVGNWPKHSRHIFYSNRSWQCNNVNCFELGCVDLPLIKQQQRYIMTKRLLKRLCKLEKEIVVCTTYLPFLKAIYHLPTTVRITAIITDLPKYADMHQVSTIKKCLRKIYNKQIYYYLSRIDRFILLTEAMALPLGVGERPYIVMEGICSASEDVVKPLSQSKNISFLYTGRLNRRYGIDTLLRAFTSLAKNDIELWICGNGEMEKDIYTLSLKDSRVKFFGFIPHDKALELQRKADVLINPRTDEGDYTRYSFPSKTMEYMASGTPVLMYKLPGIPQEYDPYLLYIPKLGEAELAHSMLQAASMEEKERRALGLRAREFILTQKNECVQSKRILDLINSE